MIYGYKRPLLNDEQAEKQLVNINYDQIVCEQHSSPKKRHALEQLMMEWQQDDIVIVQRLAVLADSMHQLLDILHVAKRDGVTLQFLHEKITSNNLYDMQLVNLVEHFANFQSENIKQATSLGLALAKKNGKSLGRPKKSDNNLKNAMTMYHSGDYTLMQIKEQTGISKSTLYRYLDHFER
ncbi:hypothetical protein AEA09_06050 [Lysinibacillus contaminans]|uniref:Resolvase/invertase-type recombinase catalytic domain-containing protein n=1 Tax=Lysinibacillus contaminans TaxID=1293441 RepID=A0ABR5K0B0_9BACI|nr:recombinase family protein [Lysinibacillus contaminans]KOS68157.1 hypothetical protein AEA09_06050 [Lysinibacillus contaminans]